MARVGGREPTTRFALGTKRSGCNWAVEGEDKAAVKRRGQISEVLQIMLKSVIFPWGLKVASVGERCILEGS